MATITSRTDKHGRTKHTVRIRIRGQEPQTATFGRRTDAVQWAHFMESEIRMGKRLPTCEARRRTLNEAIDRYISTVLQEKKPKSIAKQTMQLNLWKRMIGHKFLVDITRTLLSEERDRIWNEKTYKGTKRSTSTVMRYMSALSHVFTIAEQEWDWVDENPVRKVRKLPEPRGRMRYLSESELALLLDECRKDTNPILYPVVLLAVSTGMRQGEILNIKWEDVDFEHQFIVLHETKNGCSRSVPLLGEAYEEMEKLRGSRSQCTNLVFPAIRPTKLVDKPNYYNPQFVRKAWQRVLAKTGIQDFRFHDLRHTAASYMGMAGATHNEIAAVLGHKTLHMVNRYTHIGNHHIHGMVRNMNEKFLSPEKIQASKGNQ